MLRKGQKVVMRKAALENYGESWKDVKLIVTHSANKYMPAEKFFAQGKPDGYHPGYDESAKPQGLYDLKRQDTGEDLAYSLYDWEVLPVS